LRSLLRSAVVSALILVGYFVLPITSAFTTHVVLLLGGGLLAVCALLTWQIRAIRVSPTPLARGLGTIGVGVPLFLALFSATYYLVGRADDDAWSEPLSRLDALYFSLSTFATVGFGDVAAESQTARALVVVQMALNLVLVGVIARVVVAAVQEGMAHKEEAQRRDRT
jgi:hypothetical protein